jgi:DNA invertase Pin-like site-specific DNA recombinase
MRCPVSKKLHLAKRQKREHAPLLNVTPTTARHFGYARVSREDQVLDMQISALRQAGIQDENMFVEKVSAVDAKRPMFRLMLKCLEAGDTVLVYAFSRLHRNVKELLMLVDEFKATSITLRSTSEPHIDPFSTNGRLLLSVTGAVDENELNRIADRTRDGMAERKRQGMWFGRPRLVTPAIARDMRTLRRRGLKPDRIARRYKVKVSTVYSYTSKKRKA